MFGMDLVLAYRMYRKMMSYPHLVDAMRILFLSALEERGILNASKLEQEAREQVRERGLGTGEKDVEEVKGALIDLYFASRFSEEEQENYINLARKEELFSALNRVVNREGATSIKIKEALTAFCAVPQGDLYIDPVEAEGVRVALINHFISNQLPFISTAKKHITIRDTKEMLDHAFWNPRRPGRIGGKAAGMILAYKILVPRLVKGDPELEKYIRVPESYYFNSGIFSDFIEYNDLHHFHSQKYKSGEAIEKDYENIAQLFKKSSFPPDVEKTFGEFVESIGECPLILRSSSLLEDNFGSAFSGKYDSVFLPNQGDSKTRLKEFIWGLKQVHMSTFGPSPILYRRDHNLLDFDEKMSVLVQKVVGDRHGRLFFPFAAGVAYSRNMYRWTPRIRVEDGIVRLVFGLGTRAVDRVGSDYPRMIALSHPLLRPEVDAPQIMRYSQKWVDVLDLESGGLRTVPFRDALSVVSGEARFDSLSIHQEGHLAAPLFKGQGIDPTESCITFENFLKRSPFVSLMKNALHRLEEAYGHPVDVEFAWHDGYLYLLQCRTLSLATEPEVVDIPEKIAEDAVLFTNHRVVVSSVIKDIEYVVYVDPRAYAALPGLDAKIEVGRVVSALNKALEGKRYALFGPGRWGSNNIDLGVRVGYADINRTLVLGEVVFEEDGSTPEVSFGTHFFNDLVEARIVPVAVFPDHKGTLFREDVILEGENLLGDLAPKYASLDRVVRVLHVPRMTGGGTLHIYQDVQNQRGVGYFEHPKATG